MTTFNTELGRFHYTVMPFGATGACDVFQCKLNECFGKIEEVIISNSHSDHDQAFTTLLQTVQKCNVKLNYVKLQYKQDEVEFFGETYTTCGHEQSKDKVSAITAMPSPTNKKQVQSFIGMINYLSKFSPRLSNLAEPIRVLSKDKVPFNWGPEHQAAFIQMKKEIASAPVLTYYNPKKQTTLQKDASIKGIGDCLLQDDRPAYFASRALTDAQKGYEAIELEALAVACAMEKFHHFLYASHFLLELTRNHLKPHYLRV